MSRPTATRIGTLTAWDEAFLYRLSEPFKGNDYVIASVGMWQDVPEVLLFASDAEGNDVGNTFDIAARKGTSFPAELFESIGYRIGF